eukprot:8866354-Pyramimonas_sp.AAC.1
MILDGLTKGSIDIPSLHDVASGSRQRSRAPCNRPRAGWRGKSASRPPRTNMYYHVDMGTARAPYSLEPSALPRPISFRRSVAWRGVVERYVVARQSGVGGYAVGG